MSFRNVSIAVLALASFVVVSRQAGAVPPPVDSYTEHFPASNANWVYGPSAGLGFASWSSAGGPDGSSHISATLNTVGISSGAQFLLFQGRSDQTASNNEFVGDWLAGGMNHLSGWVYHEAPEPLSYFARVTTPGGFPGVALLGGPAVQPNTWTKLDYLIDPNGFGTTVQPETSPPNYLSTFNAVFSNVGRVQFGFVVPASMANSTANVIYRLDQVTVVPEPTGALLTLVGVGAAWLLRRRPTR